MPIEDWIEKWTAAHVRELTNFGDTQKRITDSIIDNQKRSEDKQEARMDKLEKKIEDMRTDNSAEFDKIYNKIDGSMTDVSAKIDGVSAKIDEFIKTSNEKNEQRNDRYDREIVELKTTMKYIVAGIGAISVAIVGWILTKL